jgi:hypothetical protein
MGALNRVKALAIYSNWNRNPTSTRLQVRNPLRGKVDLAPLTSSGLNSRTTLNPSVLPSGNPLRGKVDPARLTS